jgi:hypothetical protein
MHLERSNPTPEHVQSLDPTANWFPEIAQWMFIDSNGAIEFEMMYIYFAPFTPFHY